MLAVESGKSGKMPGPSISSGWRKFQLLVILMGKDAAWFCSAGLSKLHIPPSFLSLAEQRLPGCSRTCVWDGVLREDWRHKQQCFRSVNLHRINVSECGREQSLPKVIFPGSPLVRNSLHSRFLLHQNSHTEALRRVSFPYATNRKCWGN